MLEADDVVLVEQSGERVHLSLNEGAKQRVVQGPIRVELLVTDLSILVADTVREHPPIAAAGLAAGSVVLNDGPKLDEESGYFVGIGDVLGYRASAPDSDPYSRLRPQSASAARRRGR